MKGKRNTLAGRRVRPAAGEFDFDLRIRIDQFGSSREGGRAPVVHGGAFHAADNADHVALCIESRDHTAHEAHFRSSDFDGSHIGKIINGRIDENKELIREFLSSKSAVLFGLKTDSADQVVFSALGQLDKMPLDFGDFRRLHDLDINAQFFLCAYETGVDAVVV